MTVADPDQHKTGCKWPQDIIAQTHANSFERK